jgi:tetratricopeptide (TPR) repeat protein
MSVEGGADARLDPIARRALAGDVEGAVSELRALVEADPDDGPVWLTLGMVYASAARWQEARESLARAVELDGDVLQARLSYARALEKCGKLDDAAFQLLQAQRLAPGDVRPLKELGAVFYQKGLYDKAVQFLGRARGLAPDDARVWYALGLAQEARRDPGAAIAAYRQAAAIDPGFADAKKTLADLLAAMGEHEQAIAVLDDLLRVERTNEQAAINREVLVRALEEMRARRLLGRTVQELERSALVQEGQLKRRGRAPAEEGAPSGGEVVRYGARLAEVLVSFDRAGTIVKLMLLLLDPEKAAKKRDDVFQVTVVGMSGKREPANFATGITLTFLREALGIPLTHASEIYARLLGGKDPIEWGGARLGFGSVAGAKPGEMSHGLVVEKT